MFSPNPSTKQRILFLRAFPSFQVAFRQTVKTTVPPSRECFIPNWEEASMKRNDSRAPDESPSVNHSTPPANLSHTGKAGRTQAEETWESQSRHLPVIVSSGF